MLQGLFHLGHTAVARGQARETFFLEIEQFFDLAVFLPADVGQDQGRGAFLKGGQIIHYVLGRVAAHFPSGDRGIGFADPGEEQAQMVVDFGTGAHGRTGIAGAGLLLDGDGRRDARDQIDVGFAHAAQELAGERGEAFGEAALPFGEKGVESQRTLAAARQAGNHDQFSQRNVDVDVLQVVNPGASYVYLLFLHLFSWVSNGPRSSGKDNSPAGGWRWGSSPGGS